MAVASGDNLEMILQKSIQICFADRMHKRIKKMKIIWNEKGNLTSGSKQ
jgi:hypothetical protein